MDSKFETIFSFRYLSSVSRRHLLEIQKATSGKLTPSQEKEINDLVENYNKIDAYSDKNIDRDISLVQDHLDNVKHRFYRFLKEYDPSVLKGMWDEFHMFVKNRNAFIGPHAKTPDTTDEDEFAEKRDSFYASFIEIFEYLQKWLSVYQKHKMVEISGLFQNSYGTTDAPKHLLIALDRFCQFLKEYNTIGFNDNAGVSTMFSIQKTRFISNYKKFTQPQTIDKQFEELRIRCYHTFLDMKSFLKYGELLPKNDQKDLRKINHLYAKADDKSQYKLPADELVQMVFDANAWFKTFLDVVDPYILATLPSRYGTFDIIKREFEDYDEELQKFKYIDVIIPDNTKTVPSQNTNSPVEVAEPATLEETPQLATEETPEPLVQFQSYGELMESILKNPEMANECEEIERYINRQIVLQGKHGFVKFEFLENSALAISTVLTKFIERTARDKSKPYADWWNIRENDKGGLSIMKMERTSAITKRYVVALNPNCFWPLLSHFSYEEWENLVMLK